MSIKDLLNDADDSPDLTEEETQETIAEIIRAQENSVKIIRILRDDVSGISDDMTSDELAQALSVLNASIILASVPDGLKEQVKLKDPAIVLNLASIARGAMNEFLAEVIKGSGDDEA